MHADPKTAAASPDDTAKAKEAARLMAMKMLVITLGVILVALAVVVFSTLAIRAVKGGGQATPSGTTAAQSETGVRRPVQLSLPSGSRIISTTLGDGRLAVTTEGPEGAVIVLFDARTLAETGRIQVPATH
ncbi:hypothetical protein SLNSH_00725 [Alsobacter soli]|uniref:Fimbrial protein n=1 Tax=Alsobacter soli TaxID=2109933 RepID=A0A2T1HZ19_9HYPH|nr:DUF6476 family protein [Alsobacter soli]PSC06942.1 hypothetical protein SLNSH_00725 [Alsobacter soli]